MRVLLTGSRTWPDARAVYVELHTLWFAHRETGLTIVHGACWKGADRMAAEWCRRGWMNLTEERHPAPWTTGRAAGYGRNAAMVALGADLCLAFIESNSRGASHCAGLAEAAGIETRRFVRGRS